MNILVISKVSIPAKDRTLPAWQHLRDKGHCVVVEHPERVGPIQTGRFDAMIVMGVSVMEEAFAALERFPGVPLFAYQWDTYSWIWKMPGEVQAVHPSRPQEYDYVRWGQLLRKAREVWVPSACTSRQAKKWWGVENSRVILSSCPWWDPKDPADLKDGGYAFCCLRHLPDAWDTVFEECCEDLKLPYVRDHDHMARPDYERTLAGCRFIVNHYQEASTGGLSLMEAYRLGKPVLCTDSPWNGAWDYFGWRAQYFDHSSKDDFKAKLLRMFRDPPWPDPAESKRWVEDNYNDAAMVDKMLARMEACQR